MNKISILVVSLFLHSAASASQAQEIIDFMIADLKQSGALAELSSCLKVPPKKVEETYKQVAQHCVKTYHTEDDQMNQCMDQRLDNQLAALSARFSACKGQFDQDGMDDAEQDFLDQDVGELADIIEQSLGEQGGNISDISLPVIDGAKVKMHFPTGMKMGEVTTLPVATLMVNTKLAKVVAYYKNALPQFEMRTDGDTYYFAKQLPNSSLDLVTFLKQYSQMAHISVSKASDKNSVLLEISYHP